MRFFLGVKGVRVVKGVKVKCLVAIKQFRNWIFHFSLLVFHFRQTGVKVKCLVAIKQFRIWIFHFSLLVFHFRQTGVKVKCLVAIKQFRIWIFHFSLLVFHFRQTGVKVKCFVGNYNYNKVVRHKTNVPTINKINLPELSIRICDPKLIQIIYNKMEAKL